MTLTPAQQFNHGQTTLNQLRSTHIVEPKDKRIQNITYSIYWSGAQPEVKDGS